MYDSNSTYGPFITQHQQQHHVVLLKKRSVENGGGVYQYDELWFDSNSADHIHIIVTHESNQKKYSVLML